MTYPSGEPAVVERDGEPVGTYLAGYDPHAGALYFPPEADVALADTVGLRSQLYRVVLVPEVWRSLFTGWVAGVVAYVEPASSVETLPDVGVLARQTGTTFDRDANTDVPVWETVWEGPCLVEPPASADGSETEAAEQRISVQPLLVSVPLVVADVRPTDRFTVTASADPRLVGLPLQVVRVKAGSLAKVRQFSAIDNQG